MRARWTSCPRGSRNGVDWLSDRRIWVVFMYYDERGAVLLRDQDLVGSRAKATECLAGIGSRAWAVAAAQNNEPCLCPPLPSERQLGARQPEQSAKLSLVGCGFVWHSAISTTRTQIVGAVSSWFVPRWAMEDRSAAEVGRAWPRRHRISGQELSGKPASREIPVLAQDFVNKDTFSSRCRCRKRISRCKSFGSLQSDLNEGKWQPVQLADVTSDSGIGSCT